MKNKYIKLIPTILILLFGCENQKSNENDIELDKQYDKIDRQIEIISKANTNNLQEQDSIPLSLIEFSLNAKEVERMLRFEKQQQIKIFFLSKFKITSYTNSSFKIFGIDFKIINNVNESKSYHIMELVSYNKVEKEIFLKYTYSGMFIVVYLTRISNNYKIKECIVYET